MVAPHHKTINVWFPMLQFIRSKAGSFIVKILFVLLIAAFGTWGIGDFLRQRPADQTVAEVGAEKITAERLQGELRQSLEKLRQRFGRSIDMDQARAMGLVDQTMDEIVTEALLDQEAKRLGIVIGDKQVLQALQLSPSFKGPEGNFDKIRFLNVLAANHLSEAGYEALLRSDLRRSTMASVVTSTGGAPKPLVDELYRIRYEKRVADWVYLPESAVKDLPVPDDAALQAEYDQHHDAYMAPEYRGFTALIMQDADVAGDVTITEDQIKDAYQQRLGDFTKLEKRHVLQVVLPDEKTADEALKAIEGGQSIEDVAKNIAKQDPGTVDLGTLTKPELPQEIGDAAFAAKDGEVTKPVKSSFGWHVLKIAGVEPGGVKTLDEVHKQLDTDLRKEAEGDALYKLSNKVEDAIAAGADLSAIAQQFNLKPVSVAAVDHAGRDPAGKAVENLPVPAPTLTKIAFDTPAGQVSGLQEVSGSDIFYVVKTDAITPPVLKPFDQVKDEVKEAWLKEQRVKRVAEQAKALVDAVKLDTPLAKLAADQKLTVRTTKAFDRGARDEPQLPAALVNALFEQLPGGTVNVAVDDGHGNDGQYVAQLKEIQPADPAADAKGVADLQEQLDAEVKEELLKEYTDALRQRFPVEEHPRAIAQATGGEGQQQ